MTTKAKISPRGKREPRSCEPSKLYNADSGMVPMAVASKKLEVRIAVKPERKLMMLNGEDIVALVIKTA